MKRMIVLCTLLMAASLLVACSPTVDDTPDDGYDEREEADCLDKGGKYERYGMLQQYQCNLPTNDEGMECTGSEGCEGLCLSQNGTGVCSPWSVNFGCVPIIEDGEEVTICID